MLRRGNFATRLGKRHLLFLAALAVLPMAVAFAAETPAAKDQAKNPAKESSDQPAAVPRRAVNKLVKDFPDKLDLSTPESAAAAYNRASGRMDVQTFPQVTWWQIEAKELQRMEQDRKSPPKDLEVYNQAQLDAEIVEVLTYQDDLAEVLVLLKFPEGVGRSPYSTRWFGRIDGVWKNLGEDRLPSLEAAREYFGHKKEHIWSLFVLVREAVKGGRPVLLTEIRNALQPNHSHPPAVVTGEQAELMGRVENFFLHNYRDITARKSLQWGEVQKEPDGNVAIRYQYEARIWDRETQIDNKIFTFGPQGGFVSVKDVEGFPQKKIVKPIDLTTQAGLEDLVEKFFRENYHDITRRKTLEWGEPTKAADGSVSIRYKYRARILDKETKLMNEVFTFDTKGDFVSVEKVNGFPQDVAEKPIDVTTKAGLQDRVEDFFDHNYRDIKVRETLEWGDRIQADNGQLSIRCKYRARIWDGQPQLFDKIFTFDAKGGFVSVRDADGGSPK